MKTILPQGPDCPQTLIEFLDKHTPQLERLRESYKLAQESFRSCVELYAENGKTASPTTFFTTVSNFARNFKQAQAENAEREKMVSV